MSLRYGDIPLGSNPIVIPEWLAYRTELSAAAKLVYAELVDRFEEPFYSCDLPRTELAARFHVSVKTMDRYLVELKRLNLIRVYRQGCGLLNQYILEDHVWMGSA